MKGYKFKKLFTAFLACALVLTLMPLPAFAQNPEVEGGEASQESTSEKNSDDEAKNNQDAEEEMAKDQEIFPNTNGILSNSQKLEQVKVDGDNSATLSGEISPDEKWGFEAYVIPKTVYTHYYIPIYIKTKCTANFYLSCVDSQGDPDGAHSFQPIEADDVLQEQDKVNGGYKLQDADGRLFGISFKKTGQHTMYIKYGEYETILAEFKINVDLNEEKSESDFIDSLIKNLTNSSMDSFEKMSTIQSYLAPKMKYYKGYKNENGGYASPCVLLDEYYSNPWWQSFVGNSYTTPAILCKIANRVGGFKDVHNCYSDYAADSYEWKVYHHYCKCTGIDKNNQEVTRYYTICASSNTNLVDAKDASELPKKDFTNLSSYRKLTQSAEYCLITFDSLGGTNVNSKTVKKGNKLEWLPGSSKEGYTFVGWYTDKKLTTPFNANNAINSNVKLYAKWNKTNKTEQDNSAIQMYRLYNKWTGEHFYTASSKEKLNLVKAGWSDEGTGWYAPKSSKTPVYRLYNKYAPGGDHHYTMNREEYNSLIKEGWSGEGVGWYSDDNKSEALYRQYNPYSKTGTHNYTTSTTERDNVVKAGWRGEGIAWYGIKVEAFAVYSADDNSLDFYKRSNVPTEGSRFNGKATTKVFKGIENSSFDVGWRKYLEDKVNTVTIVDSGIKPINMSYWFCASYYHLNSIKAFTDLSKLDTSDCTNMCYLFGNSTMVTEITGISSWDTSKVKDMSHMFSGCEKVKSLDVTKFDTISVDNMEYMFSKCSSLTSLDVSKFDTRKASNLSYVFMECSSIKSLDVSKFNTSQVRTFKGLFEGCESLSSVDVLKFDTSKATDLSFMFASCSSLKSLNVANFNTSNVTSMVMTFYKCSSLKTLNVSKFNTKNVTDMRGTFQKCSSLVVDCTKWNVAKVKKREDFSAGAPGVKQPKWVG